MLFFKMKLNVMFSDIQAFCQWPQNSDCFHCFETDNYHFEFLAINFCLLMACYPLKYWQFISMKSCVCILYQQGSPHIPAVCALLYACSQTVFQEKKKRKRLMVFKACRIMGSLWGNLQYNSSLKTPEQTAVFHSGWIGGLEGLPSLK